jgi:hypothetical protein
MHDHLLLLPCPDKITSKVQLHGKICSVTNSEGRGEALQRGQKDCGGGGGSVPESDPDPPDPHVLGLQDPDPDPLVRGMDPDPSIIMQK